MNTLEIERKFLIDPEILPQILGGRSGINIIQTYLGFQPEVRIRKMEFGNHIDYLMTRKSVADSSGMVREEQEQAISAAEYQRLLAKQLGVSITKTRYQLCDSSTVIDCYSGRFRGLCIAEVEFASLAEANAFVPPIWFGAEVTANPAYKNASLAASGAIPEKTT